METKTLYTRDTEKAGISRSPNFHRTGGTTYQANPKFTTTRLINLIFIMKRTSYKKDFQSWKGMVALKSLCCNIVAGRFDWKKYAAMTEGGLAMKLFRERCIWSLIFLLSTICLFLNFCKFFAKTNRHTINLRNFNL